MKRPQTLILTALLAHSVLIASAEADVIAATDFNGRTLIEVNTASDTATDLGWTVNGVEDPGNMTSLNASAGGLRLFNDNTLVQNIFAPGINTGNGNTFWTTSVDLTVSAGSSVTLTDVTFNYVAVNGGQNENVDRRSDFTITIIDPSANTVASVDVLDTLAGTGQGGQPLVTATFASPISLTAPGTYKLVIKGGDFAGFNETGNHTAIDNLSINGTVGGGSSFVITETNYDPVANTLLLTWESNPGETYIVKYSKDLKAWTGDLDDGVPATEDSETTTGTFDLGLIGDLEGETKAFFRVEIQVE